MSDNLFEDASDNEENVPRMVLYVETLTGTVFEMIVSPQDTVLSIKNNIQHDEGIPVSQQHLLLGDKELTNTKLLQEEGITRGCTLKLVLGMRGGPIINRKASSRSEHLIWREIRDFVETTRDDMMSKVPPGAKITLLVYRDGDAINFLKVVENKDGSYSSLADFPKPIIPSSSKRHTSSSKSSSRTPLINKMFPPILSDSEKLNETFKEHKELTSKIHDLRRKMEEMNLRKKNRKQTAEHPEKHSEMEPVTLETPEVPPRTFKTDVRKNSLEKSEESNRKKWWNSDYYDEDDRRVVAPTGHKKIKPSKHYFKSKTHYEDVYNKALANKTFGHHRHHGHAKASSSAEGGENLATTTAAPNFFPLPSDDDEDDIFDEFNFEIIDEDDNEADFQNKKFKLRSSSPQSITRPNRSYISRYINDKNAIDSGGSGAVEDEDDEAGKHGEACAVVATSLEKKSSPLIAKFFTESSHRKSHLEETSEDDDCHAHEPSSIAILEEEPESNVGNEDEPEFQESGPISVPSPDANTFTISQIPRERVSTNKNSARNRIRVARFVLKDDDHRPKSSPDKLSREFCEFLLNNSDGDNAKKDRKHRRTKYLSNSNSKLKVACKSGEIRLAGSLLQPYYENRKVGSGIRNKGFESTSVELKSKDSSTIEHLPDIELKPADSGPMTAHASVKSHRIRCKKCNKKLNIATIYDCRCGDKFCSQHRYSEVHGCKFDYKTEGRRLIEQQNPLVLAPKLPKI